MQKKTIKQLIEDEAQTSKEWRDTHEEADNRRFMEVQSTISDIYDSMPSHIDSAIKRSIQSELPPAIEKEVNGKTKLMLKIITITAPILLAIFGYIAVMAINTSQQVAAVNAGLQLLEARFTNTTP